jgi:predicted  nucleic acid-binding Zn-ribbon protein
MNHSEILAASWAATEKQLAQLEAEVVALDVAIAAAVSELARLRDQRQHVESQWRDLRAALLAARARGVPVRE